MILTALMAVVVLGAAAIAVDLGVNTFDQRTIQNVSDAAALAGATDLGAQPTAAQQQQGITDALLTIREERELPGRLDWCIDGHHVWLRLLRERHLRRTTP